MNKRRSAAEYAEAKKLAAEFGNQCPVCGRAAKHLYETTANPANTYIECGPCQADPDGRRIKERTPDEQVPPARETSCGSTRMRTVAALYIDPRGPYPKMPGVECWDEARDARTYAGPHPVVAHPPCGPWGRLRHLYRGGEGDATCGPIAVGQVRMYGGALEHPRYSQLWKYAGLPLPEDPPDAFGGRTYEVEQVAWGHVARKKTWLYVVGVPDHVVRAGVRTGGTPTHWCSGFRTSKGRAPERYKANGCAVPPGIKVCSAQQRRRTPPAFAEWLVSLARASVVRSEAE
jgi:hypothetical protein